MKKKGWYVDYENKALVYRKERTTDFHLDSSRESAQALLDKLINRKETKTFVKVVTLLEKLLLGKDVQFSSPELNGKFLIIQQKHMHIDY